MDAINTTALCGVHSWAYAWKDLLHRMHGINVNETLLIENIKREIRNDDRKMSKHSGLSIAATGMDINRFKYYIDNLSVPIDETLAKGRYVEYLVRQKALNIPGVFTARRKGLDGLAKILQVARCHTAILQVTTSMSSIPTMSSIPKTPYHYVSTNYAIKKMDHCAGTTKLFFQIQDPDKSGQGELEVPEDRIIKWFLTCPEIVFAESNGCKAAYRKQNPTYNSYVYNPEYSGEDVDPNGTRFFKTLESAQEAIPGLEFTSEWIQLSRDLTAAMENEVWRSFLNCYF